MSKYIYKVKKNFFGMLHSKRKQGNDHETSLKEGGGIEIETTVLPLRDARSLPLLYFTYR